MPSSFQRIETFREALKEVDFLVECAIKSEREAHTCSIYNKVAILLLSAKFENFLEEIVEEFGFKLEEANLMPIKLPETIKILSSQYLIMKDDFLGALKSGKNSTSTTLHKIAEIWDSERPIKSLDIDNSFDYGKHDPKAIVKLFKRIGVEDIFDCCPVYETQESMSSEAGSPVQIDITASVNALTGYRNKIIHEDGSPSSLTYEQIRTYIGHLVLFAGEVGNCLERKLGEIVSHPI
ncbi:MAG: hypothetical protein HQK95_06265 [Nitrospirae bacterium]|nr:hypothetical protein [Nitrospirota bacterium]